MTQATAAGLPFGRDTFDEIPAPIYGREPMAARGKVGYGDREQVRKRSGTLAAQFVGLSDRWNAGSMPERWISLPSWTQPA